MTDLSANNDRLKSFNQRRASRGSDPVIEAIADAVAFRVNGQHARSLVSLTFGEMSEKWLRDYACVYFTEPSWRNYERMLRSYFSCWDSVNVYDIKRSDVQSWMSRLAENVSPYVANRARELMRAIYNKAIAWELLPDNHNPATKIRAFPKRSRERFLQADELPRFMAALQSLRYGTTRDCLTMALLTAQRIGNVKAMQYSAIDFRRKVWYIDLTKTGTSAYVPLDENAMAIILRRKKEAKNDWVFQSDRSASGHIRKVEKAWARLCERAGIDNLTPHDLRRSHASHQAIEGCNLISIAKTLNHTDLNSTAIYARLNVEEQRKAMKVANNAMLRHAGAKSANGDSATIDQLGPAFEFTGDDDWVDTKEAARLCGLSLGYLQTLRSQNSGPPYMKFGVTVKYKPSMLRAWLYGRQREIQQ